MRLDETVIVLNRLLPSRRIKSKILFISSRSYAAGDIFVF